MVPKYKPMNNIMTFGMRTLFPDELYRCRFNVSGMLRVERERYGVVFVGCVCGLCLGVVFGGCTWVCVRGL